MVVMLLRRGCCVEVVMLGGFSVVKLSLERLLIIFLHFTKKC